MKPSAFILIGVFTELISELGVKGLQVEEIYGLDESLMTDLEPIFGFIFLFKWDAALERHRKGELKDALEDMPAGVFFASQTVQNACATQAILSILLNIPATVKCVKLGNDLLQFRDFCVSLPPEIRGEAIGSSDLIRNVHNSFARPELALIEDMADRKNGAYEDPFHFISFLPIEGQVYEFDGLQAAPIAHGPAGKRWISRALQVIRERIETIQSVSKNDEIRFNLMAVIKDRTLQYRELIDSQVRLVCELENSLRLNPAASDDPRPKQIRTMLMQKRELELKLEEEQIKMVRMKKENALRRHNLVPFVVAILKEMVRTGRCDEFIAEEG